MAKKRLSEVERVAIDRARLVRGKHALERKRESWQENLDYFVGDQGVENIVGANDIDITINKVFATLRANLPALMFRNPYFTIKAERSDVEDKRKDAQRHILNHFWNDADGEQAARLAILSAHFAFGAIKVGYSPTFRTNPEKGEIMTDEEGLPMLDYEEGPTQKIPLMSKGKLWRDQDGNYAFDETGWAIPEPGVDLDRDSFLVEWVPWDRFIFDPEGGNDFRKHSWIAEEWVRPTCDLEDDPLFNTDGLEPNEFVGDNDDAEDEGQPMGVSSEVKTPSEGSLTEPIRRDAGRTRGYTIYDFRDHEIRWVCESTPNNNFDTYLRVMPMPPEMWHRGSKHGGPFAFLILNDVPNSWAGLPDVEVMKDPQDEINLQHSKFATHTRRADRKYIATEEFMEDADEWDKLTKGGDFSVATVSELNGIKPLEQMPMDPTIANAVQLVMGAFDEMAGAGGEQRGVASADTATQGAIIENRQQLRESDRKVQVSKFLTTVAGILMRSIQANLTQDVAARVEDPKTAGNLLFEGKISPNEIDGEAMISLDVSSLAPRTNATYRNQVLSFLQQVFIPMATSPIGMRFMQPELMGEFFEIFEIGNTEIAKMLERVVLQTSQALDGQAQGGTEQAAEGNVGQATGRLANGTASPTEQRITPGAQRTQ